MKKSMSKVVSLAALSTALMIPVAQAACQTHMSIGSLYAAAVAVSGAVAGAYLVVAHRKGTEASHGALTAA